MTIQISIIGLGQIGASIALALSEHKNLLLVGHDKNVNTAKAAEKMGAVHKINRNLPSSVKEADIIVLALPFGEIQETVGYFKEDLKADAVILDTAPSKNATSKWMQDELPAGRSYIGLAPVINPIYLDERERGVDSARIDLFHKAVTMIAAPTSASGEALQLAADFVQLLGSQPLFADLAEVDGVMASVHLLPQLTAVALLNSTVDAPGWGEARKVTGQFYAQITESSPKGERTPSLSAEVLANEEGVIRVLDGLIASLEEIKESVASADEEALFEILDRAEEGRAVWSGERRSADWLSGEEKPQTPIEIAGIAERLFGFRQKKPRN
ncbi:MAG: prephenate dehydrogenase [Chloroflexi bacterium]|nr:prephenate dehydrogenase [Chloroflexota bacterium]